MAKKRKRRHYTKNPAPTKARRSSRVRRAARAVGRSVAGLNFKAAFATILPMQIGMFASKAGAKLFGGDDAAASETDPESWKFFSYLKGGLAGIGAALLMGAVKPAWRQRVLEGALNFTVFKALQNEAIVRSETAMKYLGEGDEYVPDEYSGTGLLMAGETDDGEAFMLGEDGEFYPAIDDYRQPMAGLLEPPGHMGSALEPPGALGFGESEWDRVLYGNRR